MSAYRYRYTGEGKPPVFRVPLTKVGPQEYEAQDPISHPDFEAVGQAQAEPQAEDGDAEDKKDTGKAGKKSKKKDRED